MPKITFHGHACFDLEHEGHRLVIDPFLSGNPTADVGPDSMRDVTAVILTHGHGDHLGDAIPICKASGAVLVATYELALFCAEQGVERVHPMHIGGSHAFPWGRVKLVPALHGGMVEGDTTGRFTTNPAGVIVTLGTTSVYHAGDTSLTMEMQLLRGQVNVMLCPIGDNFTMGIDDAVRAVEFVQPDIVVPMHYGTFDVIAVDPAEFVQKVGDRARVDILEPGQTLSV